FVGKRLPLLLAAFYFGLCIDEEVSLDPVSGFSKATSLLSGSQLDFCVEFLARE
ncbi:hypothetical protein Dimus_022550, partial [Dionaea muscipula]